MWFVNKQHRDVIQPKFWSSQHKARSLCRYFL